MKVNNNHLFPPQNIEHCISWGVFLIKLSPRNSLDNSKIALEKHISISFIDFSLIFSLIYDDFQWIYWKITGWNLLISNGNGISTSFFVNKLYFNSPWENFLARTSVNHFFHWVVEISFLQTKRCGNAQFLFIRRCTMHIVYNWLAVIVNSTTHSQM